MVPTVRITAPFPAPWRRCHASGCAGGVFDLLADGVVLAAGAVDVDVVQDAGSLERQSILVVDSLGNDDWSFYAAETYPSANFFNMSPREPRPSKGVLRDLLADSAA